MIGLQNYAVLYGIYVNDIKLHWDDKFLPSIRDDSNMGLVPDTPHIQAIFSLMLALRTNCIDSVHPRISKLTDAREVAVR